MGKNQGALGFFGIFIAFSILISGAGGFVVALIAQKTIKRMSGASAEDVFEPFARHVSGRVEEPPPGWFGLKLKPPSVWFEHAGLPAVLRIEVEGAGKHQVAYTVLEFTLAEASPVDLRVYPQGLFQKLGKWLGMQDIEVGDAAFDEHFVVQASRESAAATFLSAGVRRALLGLSDWRRRAVTSVLGSTEYIELQLSGHSLKLRTIGFLNSAEQMIGFYELSGRVVDALFGPEKSQQ